METPPASLSERRFVRLALFLLLAGCAAAYADSLRGVFVFDDLDSITGNARIGSVGQSWAAAFPLQVKGAPTILGRPFLAFTLAFNHAVSGFDSWSYHLLNGIIHAGAALVLFGIVRRTVRAISGAPGANTGPSSSPCAGPHVPALFALAVSLVWALHPLQTESVSYVIQRAESMGGLFVLLTLYAFIRSVDAQDGTLAGAAPARSSRPDGLRVGLRRGAWEIAAVAFCLLGVATKETVALAPLLVLLYDRAFVAAGFAAALRRRWRIHAGLAGTWLVLLGLVAAAGWNRNGSIGPGIAVKPWDYWLTQPEALGRYLLLALWPHPLVFEYGKVWAGGPASVLPWVPAVVVTVGWTAWALVRRPRAGFLGAWFLGLLAPTSLLPGTTEMIVEHRMYLPLAALVAGGAWLIARRFGRAGLWALCAWSLVLGCMTAERNLIYRSEADLWRETIARRPQNREVRYRLAALFLNTGRVAEALPLYEGLIADDPGNFKYNCGHGVALCLAGRTQEGLAAFRAAAAANPDSQEVHQDLGNAFTTLGRNREAEGEFRAALKLDPSQVRSWAGLGRVLADQGRGAEAERAYAVAARLAPHSEKVLTAHANALVQAGRPVEALEEYGRAVRENPGSSGAWTGLGNLNLQAGRWDLAVEAYGRALGAGARGADLHNNLGVALLRQGRVDEAIDQLRTAVSLDPGYELARRNLERARLLYGRGQP